MVFFAVWWAWVNFTWFASAFDTDDWVYRLLTLTQMGGVVVLAVGTGAAMTANDFRVIILGYVIMRLALVAQWLRASASHPALRRTALRYATGVTLAQLAWIAFPLVPSAFAVAAAIEEATQLGALVTIGVSGFLLAAGMWWLYFSTSVADRLGDLRSAIVFGYGHYAVFAAAGAFSAGLSVLLDVETGASHLPPASAAAALTVPVGIFVIGVWALILRHRLTGPTRALVPIGGLALAACAFLPWPVPAAAVVMVALVVLVERSGIRVGSEDRG